MIDLLKLGGLALGGFLIAAIAISTLVFAIFVAIDQAAEFIRRRRSSAAGELPALLGDVFAEDLVAREVAALHACETADDVLRLITRGGASC